MAKDEEKRRTHRRRFLAGVGAAGLAGVAAGCLGDDENGNGDGNGNGDDEPADDDENGNGDDENGNGDDDENGNGDDDEPADDGNGNGDDEDEAFEIEPGTTIDLDGITSGWVGIAPEEIEGVSNPALVLQEGETYEIGWSVGDGGTHNVAIRDEDGDVVDDLATPEVTDPGEDQWLEFEASQEMAEYVCEPHAGLMVGEIIVE